MGIDFLQLLGITRDVAGSNNKAPTKNEGMAAGYAGTKVVNDKSIFNGLAKQIGVAPSTIISGTKTNDASKAQDYCTRYARLSGVAAKGSTDAVATKDPSVFLCKQNNDY